LSSEEFGLGGTQYGRASDFFEVSGDNALTGSLELRYGEELDMKWLKAFQLYTFYDLGSVWNEVSGAGVFRESVSSAGGGAKLTLSPNIRVHFEMAKPLTRPVDTRDSKGPRAFFNITASF
jgi:hemolysin activation/secretion protein